jgi:hypothetical protein
MNPFLASVSYPQGWWKNEEKRAEMFRTFQSPEWRRGLQEADTPAGTVLKEILLNTSDSQASLEDLFARRLVVAEVARAGVALPSPSVSGRQFKYDQLLTGMIEAARENGASVWAEGASLNSLLVASRTSSKGDMREVEQWMERSGWAYQSPLLGATVAEVLCVLGWSGNYCWVLAQADMGRSHQKVVQLHQEWGLEGKGSVHLQALWILLAQSTLKFLSPNGRLWEETIQKKQEALENHLGLKGVLGLCDHPSALVRTIAVPALAEFLVERQKKRDGLSPSKEWAAAWRLVAGMRPISGVNRSGSDLLSVVEQYHGPCPPSLEGTLPIGLLQHGYAHRMVQNLGDDRLPQWLEQFKALSIRPGAEPYQQVLARSLETSDVWPSSFDGAGWGMLQMESRLEIPGQSSGKPKVRL